MQSNENEQGVGKTYRMRAVALAALFFCLQPENI
jgi:hypothetical protein